MPEFPLGEAQLGTSVDLTGLKKGIDQGRAEASSGFGKIGDIIGGVLKVGVAAAAAGVVAAGAVVAGGIADAREAAIVLAQTEAVIKSTGSAAGKSAIEISDLAASLSAASGKSLFGDDDIQKSENLLLTFTNIKGEVFDAATAISVDMAQALGGLPADQAIALGKALNDPVEGFTKLQKIGVTFTEEQIAQGKAMAKAGDIAGAQKIILEELNKEFGGSAEAAAKADGGWAQFTDRLGEAQEAIGGALLPVLNELIGFLNDSVAPVVEALADSFGDLVSTGDIGVFANDLREAFGIDIGPLVDAVNTVRSVFSDLAQSFDEGGIGGLLNNIIYSLTGIQGAAWPLVDAIDNLVAAFSDAGPVSLEFAEAVGQFSPILGGVLQVVAQVLPQVEALVREVFGDIVAYFQENGAQMLSEAQTTWASIQTTITSIVGPLVEVIRAVLVQISTFWQIHGQEILAFVGTTWSQINQIIQVAMQLIQATIVPILQGIAAFINAHGTEIQQILGGAWKIISSVIDAALTLIKGILTAALLLIQGDWQGAWTTIQAMSARFMQDIFGVLQGGLEMLKGLISGGIDVIIGFWTGMPGRVAGVGQAVVNEIWNGINQVWNDMLADLRGKLQSVRDMLPFSEPKDSSSPLFGLSKAGEAIIEQIALGMQARGGELAEALHQDLGAAMENLNATIADAGVVSLETGEAIQSLLQTMGISAETADASQGAIVNLLETIADAGLGSLETEEAFGLLIDTLGLSGDAAERVRAFFTQLAQTTGIAAGDIATSSQEIASSLGDKLSDTLSDSDLPDDAEGLGALIMAGWSDAMEEGFDDLLDQVDEWSDELKQKMNDAWDVESPSGVTELLGINIMQGLLDGIDSLMPDLINQIGELGDDMVAEAEKLAERVNETIASAFDATASIDRQRAKNIEAVAKLADTVRGAVENKLDQVLKQAGEMEDPEEAAKFYQMRSRQVLEEAKLTAELIEAGNAGDTERAAQLEKQLRLIQNANKAEQAAFEQRQQNQSETEKLAEQFQDLVHDISEASTEFGASPQLSAIIDQIMRLFPSLGGGASGGAAPPPGSPSFPGGPVILPEPTPMPGSGGGETTIRIVVDEAGLRGLFRTEVDTRTRRADARRRAGG